MRAAFAHSLPYRQHSLLPCVHKMPKTKTSPTARHDTPPTKRAKTSATKPGIAARILAAEQRMSDELSTHKFGSPVTHVYDPLQYAWAGHEWFVKQYGDSAKEVLLVGMNPGPWGMAQTGVPFGEVSAVRDFLGMPESVAQGIRKPVKENKARPVEGLDCSRSEVSGRRLWLEWGREEYETAERLFEKVFVHNYCPLMFMESSGRNRTPVQLGGTERKGLVEVCDRGLREVVEALQVGVVCGIGGFAEERCKKALEGLDVMVCRVLHPSPASPAANRHPGWAALARKQICEAFEMRNVGK